MLLQQSGLVTSCCLFLLVSGLGLQRQSVAQGGLPNGIAPDLVKTYIGAAYHVNPHGSTPVAAGRKRDTTRYTAIPKKQAVSNTSITTSFNQLITKLHLKSKVEGRYQGFSASVAATYKYSLDTSSDNYYAFRTATLTAGAAKVSDPFELQKTIRDEIKKQMPDIVPFSPENDDRYIQLFSEVGTHYCESVTFGGLWTLIIETNRSAEVSKKELSLALEASYEGGVGSGKVTAEMSRALTKVKRQSRYQAPFFMQGGDLSKTQMEKFNTNMFQAWAESIERKPSVVAYELVGIWEALPEGNERTNLKRAYDTLFHQVRYGIPLELSLEYTTISLTGGRGTSGLGALTNPRKSAYEKVTAASTYEWKMSKKWPDPEWRKQKSNPVKYGDEVYLTVESREGPPLWLSGARSDTGNRGNRFCALNFAVTEYERNASAVYKWTIQKSAKEKGTGFVAHNDVVYFVLRDVKPHQYLSGGRGAPNPQNQNTSVLTNPRTDPAERTEADRTYRWTIREPGEPKSK